MPKLKTRQARIKYTEYCDIRRNAKYMTFAESDAWIHSDKSLREFLGPNRFVEQGFRRTKKGELKLK